MSMRIHRLAILAAIPVLAFSAGTALAHTRVKSTSPARNATAKTSISTVTVTFTGPIRRGSVRVSGPGGTASSSGGGRDPRNINRLRVPLKRGLRAGRYTARWTMTAADGHTQRGSFRFKLRR